MIYEHEQYGRVLMLVLGIIAVVFIALTWFTRDAGPIGLIAPIFIIILAMFQRLKTRVDESGVRWGMSFGWPGGFIAANDIVSAQIIPVTFWMGIGIHLTLRGWVWNVSLGKGVQIERRGTAPVVLGTDDPEGLLAAIERVRAA